MGSPFICMNEKFAGSADPYGVLSHISGSPDRTAQTHQLFCATEPAPAATLPWCSHSVPSIFYDSAAISALSHFLSAEVFDSYFLNFDFNNEMV